MVIHPVFEQNKEILKWIFEKYCSLGESMNVDKLGIGNYVKLMKDAGILKHNKANTLDYLFQHQY